MSSGRDARKLFEKRQAHLDARSTAVDVRRADRPAVCLDYSPREGEPQAESALARSRRRAPVERIEDAFQLARRNPRASVGDAEHGFANPSSLGNYGLGHYKSDAANDAWAKTKAFLEANLK